VKADSGAAFLLVAAISGTLAFTILASRDSLFAESNLAINQLSVASVITNDLYNIPAGALSANITAIPFYSSDGNALFYENRITASEYAHLEDQKQFGKNGK
jgi:hypothetical protein